MFAGDFILHQIAIHGYVALFLITVIEGPLATIFGGFFVSIGVLNPFLTFFLLYIADTIGDLIFYTLGYYSRKRLIIKILEWVKIEEGRLVGLDEFFKKHGGKTVFIAKFIAGAGSWTLISAGIGRMKLRTFLKHSLTAGALKTFVYMALGYFFGSMYKTLLQWMNLTTVIIIVAIMFILMMIIIRKFLNAQLAQIFEKGIKKKILQNRLKKKKKINKKGLLHFLKI